MNELSPEEINILRDYLNTESGKKLILKLVDYETTLLAEAYNLKASSSDRQMQLVNRVSGIHWVRSMINELVTKK